MGTWRISWTVFVTTLALAGCVRQEEALTDNISPPIDDGGNPPTALAVTAPAAMSAEATGMMTTVETRVRWVGRGGYHMEDLIEVTEGAPVVRSSYFDNEEILVVET